MARKKLAITFESCLWNSEQHLETQFPGLGSKKYLEKNTITIELVMLNAIVDALKLENWFHLRTNTSLQKIAIFLAVFYS